ncbi:MAG: helix-turn-helix domain-containing protein [Allosphingosinicella sp.]
MTALSFIDVRPRRTVAEVVLLVSSEFGVSRAELVSEHRGREIAHPRQVVMYLASQVTPASLPQIGRRLNRDHTTVMHGIRAVRKRMAEDPELAARVGRLRRALEPPEPLECEPAQLDFLPGPLFDFAEARAA